MPQFVVNATFVSDGGHYAVWCANGAWWIQDWGETEEGQTLHFTHEFEADTEEDALEEFTYYTPSQGDGDLEWTTIEIKEIEDNKEFLRSN